MTKKEIEQRVIKSTRQIMNEFSFLDIDELGNF